MIQRGRGLAASCLLTLAGCASVVPLAPPAPSTPPSRPIAPTAVDFGLQGRIEQGGLALGLVPPDTVTLTLDGKSVAFAPDRRFLIAFDRDQSAQMLLSATLRDGRIVSQSLSIRPRTWQTESLPTLPKGTTPTPEFLARRSAELAQISAARALDTHSEGWRQHFIWPAHGRISGVFGSQRIYAGEPGAYHAGVDVAQPAGTPVVAPADGVVILAAVEPFTLEGHLLMIDHGMGLNSAFLHLSRIDVAVGQAVRQGQPVGAVGMTGRATGPHLHWALKWRDVRLDPQPLAGPMEP